MTDSHSSGIKNILSSHSLTSGRVIQFLKRIKPIVARPDSVVILSVVFSLSVLAGRVHGQDKRCVVSESKKLRIYSCVVTDSYCHMIIEKRTEKMTTYCVPINKQTKMNH